MGVKNGRLELAAPTDPLKDPNPGAMLTGRARRW